MRHQNVASQDDREGLYVDAQERVRLVERATGLRSLDLTPRQTWDLELLLNGAFTPLRGFHTEAEHGSVVRDMRLPDGGLWPIPVSLDVDAELAADLADDEEIALRHAEGLLLATMKVSSRWKHDAQRDAAHVFGTTNPAHPGVFQLLHETKPWYIGGPVKGIQAPPHHTYLPLRHTPAQLRAEFRRRDWRRIVAFQTRNPMHRAHVELTKRAARRADAKLLLHPVVGRTSPGDVDYFARVRCYQAVLPEYPPDAALLSLLPLAMRMAGPREALWHAIIRRNYGCTHFIVGRDHAGPGKDPGGRPYYDPLAAQRLVVANAHEIGIEPVPFDELVFVQERQAYVTRGEVASGETVLTISGTELRRRLRRGDDVPSWFSYPDVLRVLRESYPPREEQGFTIFFTGLSGAGKSTIANILAAKLMEAGGRPVTLLDGDVVRKHLSSELGFTKAHRDLNVTRIGFVASEITKNRGVAVCAPIAPYAAARRQVREMVEQSGAFIEVYVSTPLEVCEARDRKGLYRKARQGLVRNFTGIDDPYEVPENADIVVDTTDRSPEDCAATILRRLADEGLIRARDGV